MFKHLRQLAAESLVYGLAGAFSSFLNIFLVPIYTRIFSPEDYGVISLIATTMAVVAIFVTLALDSAAGRLYWDTEDIADRKRTMASWAWCQLTVSTLFGIVIFVSSDALGHLIVRRADAGLYFRLMAVALPLGTLSVVTTNWLRMQRRPWSTSIYAVGISGFDILLTILFVVILRQGIAGIYWAQILSSIAATAVAVWLMKDWLHPRHVDWSRLSYMLRYAAPLIPAALAFWIVSFSDRYFVQMYTSTSEVGLYQIGSYMAALIALVSAAFQQAWGAFYMSLHKNPEAKQVYAAVFIGYWWLMCALSTALAILAPEALRIVTTERYSGASSVVGFLAFSYVMIGLAQIAATGPTIAKTTRPTGIAITVAAALNILLNFLLVPSMGKVGSAIATLISQSIVPIYVFYQGQRLYPIPYRFGKAAGLFIFSWLLIWIGTGWTIPSLWGSIAAKVILLSLFIPALIILRIITLDQLLGLRYAFRRFTSAISDLKS